MPLKKLGAELTTFDLSKMDFWIAMRNSLGVAIALLIGLIIKQPVLGLLIGLGAINVAFADSREAYAQRIRRMLASTALCFLAVLLGSVSVYNIVLATLLASVWGFAAGLAVVMGSAVADLFLISLTLFIITATQPIPFERALFLASLTAVGGLVQIILSVCLWAFRRYRAERKALSRLFTKLAHFATLDHNDSESPFGSEIIGETRLALASALNSNSRESDRYKFLLAQGERIRVALLALSNLKNREESSVRRQDYSEYLTTVRLVLESISSCLYNPRRNAIIKTDLQKLADLTARFEGLDSQRRLVALNGQLRAAADISENLDVDNWSPSSDYELQTPRSLRYGSRWATVKANLNFNSIAFRHGTRLAFGVLVGEIISHLLTTGRTYWIPMTIVIVLKPDYSATISRGLLRIFGTFLGILFSAALFHYLTLPVELEIVVAAMLMFLLRWIGTTNYGIFAFMIANLVVFLFAIEGVAPESVMTARCINTGIGGAVAILIYLLWPTFEKVYVAESFANLLDTYRSYFSLVARRIHSPAINETSYKLLVDEIDRVRIESRVARSNHEGSIIRFSKEPGAKPEELKFIQDMQASSNRFIHAAMALDAQEIYALSSHTVGVNGTGPKQSRLAEEFTGEIEKTFSLLSQILRTKKQNLKDFPDLRAKFNELVTTPNMPSGAIEMELDRITNSLGTLKEQALTWCQQVQKR